MKNFIARGDALEITASADIASGDVVVVNDLIGIAAGAIANGEKGILNITCTYEVPKAASQAWAVGEAVYWDTGNGEATTTDTGNLAMGFAANAVAGGANDTLGHVRLVPTVPPVGA